MTHKVAPRPHAAALCIHRRADSRVGSGLIDVRGIGRFSPASAGPQRRFPLFTMIDMRR